MKKKEFYKIFNEFKYNNEGYEQIDVKLNHNENQEKINPKEHLKIVEKLDIKLNPLYFKNLHTYGIRGIIFDKGCSGKYAMHSCTVVVRIISP